MNEPPQSRAQSGRPRNGVDTEPLVLRLDPVTAKMLEALKGYGRFGPNRQDVVLYILRSWLWENEARLRIAISSKDRPLGFVPTESE
jgi:hypothetical protein